ncbi:MAG: alanine--glyoxylate aminotransferase family protein, partial [bacterium]
MQFKYRMHAPGPVSVPEESRFEMAGSQVYHRSDQFREKLAAARRLLQKLMKIDWPVVLASASGTGGMQIAAHN